MQMVVVQIKIEKKHVKKGAVKNLRGSKDFIKCAFIYFSPGCFFKVCAVFMHKKVPANRPNGNHLL